MDTLFGLTAEHDQVRMPDDLDVVAGDPDPMGAGDELLPLSRWVARDYLILRSETRGHYPFHERLGHVTRTNKTDLHLQPPSPTVLVANCTYYEVSI